MKKLYLSKTDKKIAGVCGGIGEWLDADSTVIRLLWIFIAVVTMLIPTIIAYLIAWAVIPNSPKVVIHDAD